MTGKLARWRALDPGERWRLLCCALALPLLHGSLAILGYGRTRRFVERISQVNERRNASAKDLGRAKSLARLAAIAGRNGPVHATCLRQSLLIHGWLRRRGLNPVLHLGVAERNGPFQAHAWVELDGHALRNSDQGHHPFVSTAPAPPEA